MYGFSTNWFPENIKQSDVVEFVKISGINAFELSYRATPPFIGMISDLVEKGLIKIQSVHDVCPRPDGYKCESLASLDERERTRAVELTAGKTIESAVKVNADRIVLHLGQVDTERNTKEMIRIFARGQDDFEKYKKDFIAERKEKAPEHLEQVKKSLRELIDIIGKRRIKLAIENRFWYEEFPDFDEIGLLLDAFAPDNVSYWHDTSHAQAMDVLGFCKQEAYLDAYGNRLAGFHISDMLFRNELSVDWLADYESFRTEHKAPGFGNIDFRFLKKFQGRSDIRFIFEFYKMVTLSQICEGMAYLEKI